MYNNFIETTYKISGDTISLTHLWNGLKSINATNEYVDLNNLKHWFEIEDMDISGDITFCDVEYDMSNNITMITITTESYDKVSHNIFNEINFMFNKKLKISFVEVSGENCYKHNEGAYPHECCVLADGSPFDLLFYDPILTIDDAIDYWFKKMKLNKLNKTQKELVEYINNYQYEDEDVTYYIGVFQEK